MANDDANRIIPAIKGRLSFHEFDAEKAHAEALAGPFAKGAEAQGASKPYANVLITEPWYDQIVQFLEDKFFPYCNAQYKIGSKERNAATPKETKMLLDQIRDGEKTPYNVPLSPPSEKTLALWPEAHRNLKCVGRLGKDLKPQAIVRDLGQLIDPDPDKQPPFRVPLSETTIEMYNGCWVLVQVEFYLYRINANPGVSANISTVVFASDDTPFSGGAELDDDALFAALDD